jgi:hypothetical protein
MKFTATALALMLCTAMAAAQEPSLFQLSLETASRDGKPVTVTFKEIARTPTSSTVEFSEIAGGSVSGPMLMMKCICGLTRARGEQFFSLPPEPPASTRAKPVSGSPVRMEVTFPTSGPAVADPRQLKPGEPIVFSMTQCDLLKF